MTQRKGPSHLTGVIALLLLLLHGQALSADKQVIAQRGGADFLTANNLVSLVLAASGEADAIVQELVMSRDDELVVFDGLHLNNRTNVAEVFPGRHREDGLYYVIDFSLTELRRLKQIVDTASLTPADTFLTAAPGSFQHPLHTLQEELLLIRQLEGSRGKSIGIAVEIQHPWFHTQENKDISLKVLEVLKEFGYTEATSPVSLHCYDPDELQRIHNRLLRKLRMTLPLVQLIDDNDGSETRQQEGDHWRQYNYDWMFTTFGLKNISTYADGVALTDRKILDFADSDSLATFIENCHILGLLVYAHQTLPAATPLPALATSQTDVLSYLYFTAQIDGLITRTPQAATAVLAAHHALAPAAEPSAAETKTAAGQTQPATTIDTFTTPQGLTETPVNPPPLEGQE